MPDGGKINKIKAMQSIFQQLSVPMPRCRPDSLEVVVVLVVVVSGRIVALSFNAGSGMTSQPDYDINNSTKYCIVYSSKIGDNGR